MIPDRLQDFLDHFWNDEKCDQIWTLGPHIHHQKISTNIRKYGNIFENFDLPISENLKLCKCWKVCVPFFKMAILKMKILELTSWNWKMTFGNLKIGKLSIGQMAFGNFKVWEIRKFGNREFEN